MTDLTTEFTDFTNSLENGYMKTWKAANILATLTDAILNDQDRLYNHLSSSLDMEGFSPDTIGIIQLWLVETLPARVER